MSTVPSRHNFSSHRGGNKAKAQVNAAAVSASVQTQFDMALSFLRHQLQQQPAPMTSLRRGGDVTPSATESLLLAALGLATPAGGHLPGDGDGEWSPTGLTVDLRRYKTELCRAYVERGACRYGERCQFAHGTAELRALQRHPKYKTELCRTYHTSGFCPYGARCHFVHNGAAAPPPPPPTPRDLDPRHCDVQVGFPSSRGSNGCAVPDSIQLSLLSAALEKHAATNSSTASQAADMTTSSTLSEVMTSVLQRRRPQMTLTLDAPRYSPPCPGPAAAHWRRSSASIDSGYGSSLTASPTFPAVVDVFSPPPLPPPPSLSLGGPLTAPLPSVAQSPGWLGHQPYPPPVHHVRPPRPTNTGDCKNQLHFVFDGLALRP